MLRELLLGMVLAAAWTPVRGTPAGPPPPDAADAFFGLTQVHDIHLVFTAAQWDAMEPQRRAGEGFPGAGGPGGPNRGGPMNLSSRFEQGDAQRPGVAGAIGIAFNYVEADVEIGTQRLGRIGVRYKGNGTYLGSQSMDKRPLKLDFNRFVKGQAFLGLRMLNLHNHVVDKTCLREALGHAVARELGIPAPRTAYARVFVTVAGRHERVPLGLYTVTEQPDDDFLKRWFGSKKGILMKPGSHEGFRVRGSDWEAYRKPLNVQEDGSPEEQQRMIAFLRLLGEASDEEFARRVGDYVDLRQMGVFLALNAGLVNLDSILTLGQNFYLHLAPDGRLHAWLWDLDNCWGAFGFMGSPEQRVALSIAQPWIGENRFVERLLKVEACQRHYRDALARLFAGPLEPTRFRKQVETLAACLRPRLAEEGPESLALFEEAVFGTARSGDAAAGSRTPGFGPFGGPPPAMVAFVERRGKSVEDQLQGRSRGEVLEGGFPGGGPRGPGGPRGMEARGPGGRGRAGGPGGPGEGGPGPGPGMLMAMPFLREAGLEPGAEMKAETFREMGPRWFKAWDVAGNGAVDRMQLEEGIHRSFQPPPGFGPAPGQQKLRPNAAPAMGMFRGPGIFLAGAFMEAGDADTDGRLTSAEVVSLFDRWSQAWDKDGNAGLSVEELVEGLSSAMRPPPGGFPGPVVVPLGGNAGRPGGATP